MRKSMESTHSNESIRSNPSTKRIARDPDLDSLCGEAAYKKLFARKDEYQEQASERAVRLITENLARQKISTKAYKSVYDGERRLVYLYASSDDAFAQVRRGLDEFADGLWRDLFDNKQEHPIWIKEGLSTLFESSRREDGKVIPMPSYRIAVMQQAVKAGRSIPWKIFVSLPNATFNRNSNLGIAIIESYKTNRAQDVDPDSPAAKAGKHDGVA